MGYLLDLLTPADFSHLALVLGGVFFVVGLNLSWYYSGKRVDAVRRAKGE